MYLVQVANNYLYVIVLHLLYKISIKIRNFLVQFIHYKRITTVFKYLSYCNRVASPEYKEGLG